MQVNFPQICESGKMSTKIFQDRIHFEFKKPLEYKKELM